MTVAERLGHFRHARCDARDLRRAVALMRDDTAFSDVADV
jgi:hypothetical protein